MLHYEMKEMSKLGNHEALEQLLLHVEKISNDGKNRRFDLRPYYPNYADDQWIIDASYGEDGFCNVDMYFFKMRPQEVIDWCKFLIVYYNINEDHPYKVLSYYTKMINALATENKVLFLALADQISRDIFFTGVDDTQPLAYERSTGLLKYILRKSS